MTQSYHTIHASVCYCVTCMRALDGTCRGLIYCKFRTCYRVTFTAHPRVVELRESLHVLLNIRSNPSLKYQNSCDVYFGLELVCVPCKRIRYMFR